MTNPEWISASGLFNHRCEICGVDRVNHQEDTLGHWWIPPWETMTQRELHALMRTRGRERRDLYSAPLPSPEERKRIREDARWTQQKVAAALFVSRHTVSRFERKAGWLNDERLPGREPSGPVRQAYSELLLRLSDDAGG